MSPLQIASLVFACVFGSALLGLVMRAILPEHHLSTESRDVVRLGTGLVATLAALVLSLLISSAKGSFDRTNDELVQNAARMISLDRALGDYGPETAGIRELVKRAYATRIDLLFPSEQGQEPTLAETTLRTDGIRTGLWELVPRSETQRGLRSQALEIANDMSSTRWLLLLQKDQALPTTLLVVLVAWLAVIFVTFGLFAPRNGTVIAVLFVCALSTSGAILLILEMNSPFKGLMHISSAPMRHALAELGK